MDDTLYLLRTADAAALLCENLELLAAGVGESVRLVCTGMEELELVRGVPVPVVLVYGDPPLSRLLPVRTATLTRHEHNSVTVESLLYLTLGSLLPAQSAIAHSSTVQLYHPEGRSCWRAPGLPSPGDSSLEAYERWRSLVRCLTSHDYHNGEVNPYWRALFFYPHGLVDSERRRVQEEGLLHVGEQYRLRVSLFSHALASGQRAAVETELMYPQEVLAVTEHRGHDEVILEIQPLRASDGPLPLRITFWHPEMVSGVLHYQLPPVVSQPRANTTSSRSPQHDPLRMVSWLSERLSDGEQLVLLDQFLLPNGGAGNPDLLLKRAQLLQRQGDVREALRTIEQIPPAQRNDETTVLLLECAVAVGKRIDYVAHLATIGDWQDMQRTRRVARVIATLPEETALEVARYLLTLAPYSVSMLWQEVAPALQQPSSRLAFVHVLDESAYPLSPDELWAYLAQDTEPGRLDDSYLNYVMEIALKANAPSGVGPYFLEWMRRRLSTERRSEVQRVHQVLESHRHWLSTKQRERATMRLVEAMCRCGLGEKAAWLALSRVEEAMQNAEFAEAERWLREARDAISAMPAEQRSEMYALVRTEDASIKKRRHDFAASFAPVHGGDPGLAAILELYDVECADAFWADLADALSKNEHVVRQLIERLQLLQQYAQQAGSSSATIHKLDIFPGNVARLELTDSARLIFKQVGRRIRLVALYTNHDAYDEALKQRWELMNRLR